MFEGKTAIVTGGARGQGLAEATLLAQRGAAVLVCDVLEAEGRSAVAALNEAGLQVRFAELDVCDPASWDAAVASMIDWKQRIDVLVNNAGILKRQSIADMTLDAWRQVIDVNLTGAFLGIKAVRPAMSAQGAGSIVNIASNSAYSGHYDPAYTASKWGMRGLTKTAALELVREGIRVNAVCPGLVVTGLNQGSTHLEPMIGMTPMRRAGTPDEIARLVAFLASDEASFITGEDFAIDGGFTAGAAYRRVAVETGLLGA